MDAEVVIPEFKVIILGDSSIGKTSIVQRYIQESFDYQMDTTIGASFIAKEVRTPKGPCILNLWDTAGQERYRSLITTYARGASAALVCYDVTNVTSFQSIERWLAEVFKICSTDLKIIIVGNKADLTDTVPIVEAEDFAISHGYPYFRTSAKSGYHVQELFNYVASELIGASQPKDEGIRVSEESKEPKKNGCC